MSIEVRANQSKVLDISKVRPSETKPKQSGDCTVKVLESCIILHFLFEDSSYK